MIKQENYNIISEAIVEELLKKEMEILKLRISRMELSKEL